MTTTTRGAEADDDDAAAVALAAHMTALTTNATTALVVMDARQHCTFLNPAAEALFGFSLHELRGKPLHDFVHHTRPDGRHFPMEECPIDRALPTRMQEKGEDVFVRRDGTFYPVAFTASPILEGGHPVGTVIEIRDVTEERRTRALEQRRMKHATVVADVSSALTRGLELRPMLQHCCEALVAHLDAAFARVWTADASGQVLELQASAGMYTHIDGGHAKVPFGAFKIGAIAVEQRPHLTNDVPHDPRVGDHAWAAAAGMRSFAGYPLLVDGRTVGVIALFARHELAEDVTKVLASISDAVALGIERLKTEHARRESEERFRNMADSAPVMLWVTDSTGSCTYLNRHWYEFTGQTEETGLGYGWLDAVHPDDAKRSGDIFVDANARHAPFRIDYRLRRKDGVYRWAIDSASPRFGSDGEYLGYVGSVIDITDRKEAEEAIRRINTTLEERVRERTEMLEAVNRELEAFSYSVSHDLRAPLRHIAGFAGLLERRAPAALDPKAKEYVRIISESAQRGGELVDELLAFSRLGRAALRKEPLSMNALVEAAKRDLAPEWSERRVEWRISPLPPVHGDSGLVRGALRNLFSNALKYSRTRDVSVVEVFGRELDGGAVEISVRDNGVGFDMTYADKLFGVFQRLHSPEEFEGVGIGLANVRRIVERHGGRVRGESLRGEGATFTMTFPPASV